MTIIFPYTHNQHVFINIQTPLYPYTLSPPPPHSPIPTLSISVFALITGKYINDTCAGFT